MTDDYNGLSLSVVPRQEQRLAQTQLQIPLFKAHVMGDAMKAYGMSEDTANLLMSGFLQGDFSALEVNGLDASGIARVSNPIDYGAFDMQGALAYDAASKISIIGQMSRKIVLEATIRKLEFHYKPELLPDLFALWRRLPPDLKQMLVSRYDFDLGRLAALADDKPLYYSFLDYSAVPFRNRYILAGPFLDIRDRNGYPPLDFATSDPARGVLTYLFRRSPCDAAVWKAKLPQLIQWFGAPWEIGCVKANSITLVLRTPLPNVIPYQRTLLRKGALYVGLDTATRENAYIPFADLSSGILVPGVAGTGKSNALHVLLRSLFANLDLFTAIYLVDGKDGVAFTRYRNLHPKIHVLWEDEDLWAITPGLVADMKARNRKQIEAGIDNAKKDFVAVVIDEMSTYTPKPSSSDKDLNKRHGTFIDELTALARRGRSVGYRFFFTVQEPTDAQIPTSIRNNCQTVISFRIGIEQHATGLFGKLDHADPRQLPRGHAIIKDGQTGAIRTVKFPVIEPPARNPTSGGR
jgi:hypothetical protein